MNRYKFVSLFIMFMLLSFFANSVLAAKKVIVITGATKADSESTVYPLIYKGINESFKEAGIKPIYQWVELITLKSNAAKAKAGKKAIKRARALKPDLIIVVNDDCLRHVGMKIDDIPVIFTYIFAKPSSFGLPKPNITGILRASYAADIWRLANKLLGVKTVALMSKNTVAMQGVRKYLFAGAAKLKAASGVELKEMYLIDTFKDWKKKVKNFPADFIYLADTSRISKGKKYMSRQEITSWTVANSKKPVIAATALDASAGALFSIVTSERAIGQNTADVGKQILNGKSPSQIKYVKSVKGSLIINLKTAKKYKIDIPYDIISSADKVYE